MITSTIAPPPPPPPPLDLDSGGWGYLLEVQSVKEGTPWFMVQNKHQNISGWVLLIHVNVIDYLIS